MQQFLLQRVGLALLALIGLSILTFALVKSTYYAYGDAISATPTAFVQYGWYIYDLFLGNLEWAWGLDYGSDNVVLERLAATLRLTALALATSAVLGISLGVLAGINRGTPLDRWANRIFLLVQAIPIFWVGITLVGASFLLPGWLSPVAGSGFTYMILPTVTLALLPTVVIAKLVRSALVAALESDYVKMARIKGVTEWKIIWKHCLSNVALSPLLSFGLIGGAFMTSLVLTEAVFQWPGAGLLTLEVIEGDGYHPMLSGVVLVLAGGFILCHLIYDVVRAFLDPRIRYGGGVNLDVEMGLRSY